MYIKDLVNVGARPQHIRIANWRQIHKEVCAKEREGERQNRIGRAHSEGVVR